jgi:hypothetical protein
MSSGLLLGITIVVATFIAYVAYKNHWKVADYF